MPDARIEPVAQPQPFQLTLDERALPVWDSGIAERASRKSVKKGGTVTYKITLTNTGTVPIDQEWVNLSATKPNREGSTAKQVKYLSITTTRGKCHRQIFFASQKGAQCAVGRLAPGQFAVITAKLKLGQSITHWAFLDYAPGTGEPPPDDNQKNDQAKVLTTLKK